MIAWFVLMLPCDVPRPPLALPVAVWLEIADANETYLTLTRLCDRWESLRGMPHLVELARFPDAETARTNYIAARSFLEFARNNRAWNAARWAAWNEIVEETSERCWAWDVLTDARNTHNGTMTRRLALGRLRGILGREAWGAGVMPPPVVTLKLD